jgi:peroxiredoxin
LPVLKELHRKYAEQGLKIVAINITSQDEVPKVRAVQKKFDLPFLVLLDEDDIASLDYHFTPLRPPINVLVDSKGTVFHKTRLVPQEQVTMLMKR